MLDKAWKQLKEDGVGIMGFYGMGGVGKTTLLTQINNKFGEERCGFDFVIWVVVSKELQLDNIQDEVARKVRLGGEAWREKQKSQKTEEMYNFLRKKRFVLLLDDIWEKVDLTKIGIPIPTVENRCKVAFTTRSQDVCAHMGVEAPMEVQCLSDNDAFDLFQKKVGQVTLGSDPEIPDLARIVARKCRGLPLALNVIGETMSCQRTIQEWRHAIDILTSYAIEFSWKGQDCCHGWYGVSCDPTNRRVSAVTLRGISEEPIFQRAKRKGVMTGSISPAICELTQLSGVTLSDWEGISGEIPACITNLPAMRHVDLVGNKISGVIPANIGNLLKLTVLNLADNQISGAIPASIARLTSLTHLDLRNNGLTGVIPVYIGRLKMLSRVLLSGNKLSGQIPESLTRIYRLADLELSMNRITGPIPPSFGRMSVLATLNLDGNLISGEIPGSLMTSSISNLNLSGNFISGKIPNAFGPRSYFTVLDLSNNRLEGVIPESITTASFIGHLDVSHNQLCGKIPAGSPFDHLDATSFGYNRCLCGTPLGDCGK